MTILPVPKRQAFAGSQAPSLEPPFPGSSSLQFERIPCLCFILEAGASGITRSQAGAWERVELCFG